MYSYFLSFALLHYRFVPFSGGPRKCVGDQFALLEAIVALAILLQHMDCELVPDQDITMTTGATIHTTNVNLLYPPPTQRTHRHTHREKMHVYVVVIVLHVVRYMLMEISFRGAGSCMTFLPCASRSYFLGSCGNDMTEIVGVC